MKTLGQQAFEAYSIRRGAKNHDGSPTPAWDVLGSEIQEAWGEAARAAVDAQDREPDTKLKD